MASQAPNHTWNFQSFNNNNSYVQTNNGANQPINQYSSHQMMQPPPPPPPPPPPTTAYYQTNVPPAYPINGYGVPLQSQVQYQPSTSYFMSNNGIGQQLHNPFNPSSTIPPPPPPPPQKHPSNTLTTIQNPASSSMVLSSSSEINSIFSCETCSITFPSQLALQSHLSSHITCKHPNCNFTASKKVVNAHYSSNHGKYAGRGLKTVIIQPPGCKKVHKFKICVGNHPADIKAWIAERKKRFPTRNRIIVKDEKKKRSREEGAIIVGRHMSSQHQQKKIKFSSSSSELINNKNDDSCKQEVINSKKNTQDETLDAMANIACYGSSSDDDSDADTGEKNCKDEGTKNNETKHEEFIIEEGENSSIPSTTTITITESRLGAQKSSKYTNTNSIAYTENQLGENMDSANHKFKTRQCRFFLNNGTCKNGDQCTYIHDTNEHEQFKSKKKQRREIQSQKDKARNEAQREINLITTGKTQATRSQNGVASSSQTLLRKLLQNDIRRERSICLQLLRYIVDCNYLQERRNQNLKTL